MYLEVSLYIYCFILLCLCVCVVEGRGGGEGGSIALAAVVGILKRDKREYVASFEVSLVPSACSTAVVNTVELLIMNTLNKKVTMGKITLRSLF